MSITIKRIAEIANVSRGTVDRVIHERGGVKKEIQEKIESIMQSYGYESNRYARALVTSKKEFLVGVIINSVGNAFFDCVLDGLVDQTSNYKNIQLVIKEYKGYDEKEQLSAIQEIVGQHIQALLITPINEDAILDYLNTLHIPIVTINNDVDVKKLAFVGCDYYRNGQMSADIANIALPEGGDVAVIVGSFKLRGHLDRIAGFKSVFRQKKGNIHIYENQDDDQESYKLVQSILKTQAIDLFYFAAAGIAGGLQALKDAGYQGKIITVDETKAVKEALNEGYVMATITQQPFKQGSRAIKIAHDYLVYNSRPETVMNLTGNRVQLQHMPFRKSE